MNNKKYLVSFFIGVLVGGALTFTCGHYCRHHFRGDAFRGFYGGANSKKMLEKLTAQLNLNSEQQVQIEKVLESKLPKMQEIRESARPQLQALRSSLQAEIRAILKPEQQEKFDKIIQKFEKSRAKWKEKLDR